MPGFPARPTRSAFGPTRTDDGVVTDPERSVDAAAFNLSFAQIAGCGLCTPRAWAILVWDGAAIALGACAEAWDPDDAAAPALSTTGAGLYLLTYAATYLDHTGNAVATGLVAGIGAPQVLTAHKGLAVPRANGYEVDVRVYDAAEAAADASVLVVLW